jgi:hypothetical protein
MNISSKTVLIPSIVLLIGTVLGSSATSAFADDPFKNKVKVDDDIKQKNDCDVDASAPGSNACFAATETHTDTINVQGEKNKVDLDFDTKQRNECEGEASATNSVICGTFVTHDIGEINILPP